MSRRMRLYLYIQVTYCCVSLSYPLFNSTAFKSKQYQHIKSDLNFIIGANRGSTVIRCQVSRSSSWADTAVIS